MKANLAYSKCDTTNDIIQSDLYWDIQRYQKIGKRENYYKYIQNKWWNGPFMSSSSLLIFSFH